jgi:hypothetical protein
VAGEGEHPGCPERVDPLEPGGLGDQEVVRLLGTAVPLQDLGPQFLGIGAQNRIR